jgi:hypothetical protein
MSAQANITVFDGATTPVSHTLTASGVKMLPDGSCYALWREQLATLPIKAQVRVEMKQRELSSKVVETRTESIVPVMESISGQNASGYTAAPKVAYEDKSVLLTYRHPRSTIASSRLCKQLLLNLMNNSAVTNPAISAGVIDEVHVQLVFPS